MTTRPRSILLLALAMSMAVAAIARADVRKVQLHDDQGHLLRFEVKSTKAGLVETTAEGHVTSFGLSYDRDGSQVKNARLLFAVRSMTTGNEDRDEKMHGFCLDAEHHPDIEVAFDAPLTLGKELTLPARINVRGEWRPIRVHVATRESGRDVIVEGSTTLSLSALGIPDPSIWIAKVNDRIPIRFRIAVRSSEP